MHCGDVKGSRVLSRAATELGNELPMILQGGENGRLDTEIHEAKRTRTGEPGVEAEHGNGQQGSIYSCAGRIGIARRVLSGQYGLCRHIVASAGSLNERVQLNRLGTLFFYDRRFTFLGGWTTGTTVECGLCLLWAGSASGLEEAEWFKRMSSNPTGFTKQHAGCCWSSLKSLSD